MVSSEWSIEVSISTNNMDQVLSCTEFICISSMWIDYCSWEGLSVSEIPCDDGRNCKIKVETTTKACIVNHPKSIKYKCQWEETRYPNSEVLIWVMVHEEAHNGHKKWVCLRHVHALQCSHLTVVFVSDFQSQLPQHPCGSLLFPFAFSTLIFFSPSAMALNGAFLFLGLSCAGLLRDTRLSADLIVIFRAFGRRLCFGPCVGAVAAWAAHQHPWWTCTWHLCLTGDCQETSWPRCILRQWHSNQWH